MNTIFVAASLQISWSGLLAVTLAQVDEAWSESITGTANGGASSKACPESSSVYLRGSRHIRLPVLFLKEKKMESLSFQQRAQDYSPYLIAQSVLSPRS
jgi:hypothetical protein